MENRGRKQEGKRHENQTALNSRSEGPFCEFKKSYTNLIFWQKSPVKRRNEGGVKEKMKTGEYSMSDLKVHAAD